MGSFYQDLVTPLFNLYLAKLYTNIHIKVDISFIHKMLNFKFFEIAFLKINQQLLVGAIFVIQY